MSLRYVRAKTLRKSITFSVLATLMFIPVYGQSSGVMQVIRNSRIHSFAAAAESGGDGRTKPQSKNDSKPLVTVADAIQMTRIAGRNAINSYSGSLAAGFASFSPDGKRLVFLVKKGKVQENTNEYSMLLYETSDLFKSPQPRTLVSFSSSSNRPAIDGVNWLGDSDTILFLGERPGETTQLYSVECASGRIRKMTNHPTNLLGYSASAQAEAIAYFAEKPSRQLANEEVLLHGFHVSNERLSDLIGGRLEDFQADLLVTDERRAGGVEHLTVPDMSEELSLSTSPDGHYLVLKTLVPKIPASWSGYKEGLLQNVMRQKLPNGVPTQVQRYTLVDLQSGESRVLLDSPVSFYGSEVKWLSDSRSVVLTGVYLPLNVPNPLERAARETSTFVVEVKISTLEVSKITERDMEVTDWDPLAQVLRLKERRANHLAPARIEEYEKTNGAWERVKIAPDSGSFLGADVLIEQDLNSPPRVVVTNPKTGQRAILLDLNPRFKDLAFGKVQAVKWKAAANHEVEGGLYLPPDYVPGKKYPLVIQTHGFDPHAFWVDGPFSTAFAAQPLAAKGIVVLQVPDSHDWSLRGTPQEAPTMMKTYESAIDYLDRKGIIDRNRVGLIGFSQTCFYVQYMLTHSKYKIAAAVVADGIDGGYFQYMAFANSSPYVESIREDSIGAAPFGEGLKFWLNRSPGFLLDRVSAPILIQAIGPSSLPEEWEWFAGLSRLKKAVDFVYIPCGYHILQKPSDRLISQQGDVDWFCFWLSGDKDPDPAKSEQYSRWGRLSDFARHN